MGPGIEPFWRSINVDCQSAIVAAAVAAAPLISIVLLVILLPRRERRWRSPLFRIVVCLAALTAAANVVRSREARRSSLLRIEQINELPRQGLPERHYVSSQTCRACHPEQYATWHSSFHRTMTQAADAQTVIGDFGDIRLRNRGRSYRLFRENDAFWADMVDPDWEAVLYFNGVYPNRVAGPPRTVKRVVMTTGSHHQQGYWVGSANNRMLYNLPFMWLREAQRWVPREDVFMRPPEAGRGFDQWNDNCIECHSVAGEPEIDPRTGRVDTQVAELGIACEACHGPAEEHVRVNMDPFRRYRLHRGGGPDPTIVNPSRLDGRLSSQVCGQCHGLNVFKSDVMREGVRYRPGDDLWDTRMVLQITDAYFNERERADWPRLLLHINGQQPSREQFIEDRMWPDGMVRVTGREHNMLMASPCRADENFSCLSCHSMHQSHPDDQLASGMESNEACLQCHGEYRGKRLIAHTRHRADSSGSLCYNCHMPHTTYGLLKAVRSHQITSPSVAIDLSIGRPNACNLCHLDQTLAWTQRNLREWYEAEPLPLDAEQQTIAASIHCALTGDAHQRALIAWHMGWESARRISGKDWMGPILGHLLADPYSVVRFVACRSFRTLPGLNGFQYDYVAPPEVRSKARATAIEISLAIRPKRLDRAGPSLLMDEHGDLDADLLSTLSRRRNDRRLDLRE